MHYIVGLGNPGKEYEHTLHNIGFLIAQWFVEDHHFPSFHDSGTYSGSLSEGTMSGEDISVLLPSTFMNASGQAVKKLVAANNSRELIVIHDDVDLPLGQFKVSFDRGDGGHNGIKSITEALNTSAYARLRIGVARKGLFTGTVKRPQGDKLAQYVLRSFSKGELETLEKMRDTLNKALELFIANGIERTMNTFN